MNDRQRQTEFLRQCLLYEDSSECHTLAEGIRQLQRNEHCVRRAVWLMILVAGLALAGFACVATFLDDLLLTTPPFMLRFMNWVSCVLGLSSLICLPAFVGLEMVYHRELDKRREECRRLAAKLLESRLGKPRTMIQPRVAEEREVIEPVRSSADRELSELSDRSPNSRSDSGPALAGL